MPPPRRKAVSNKPGPKSAKKARETRAKKAERDYECEFILGIQYNHQKQRIEYKVSWKNFDLSSSTWEPEGNLAESPDPIDKFNQARTFLYDRFIEEDYETDNPEVGSTKFLKDHWEVEAIAGIQLDVSDNQIQYLIKWRGWDHNSNSWEPKGHMSNCKARLASFVKALYTLDDVRQELGSRLKKKINDLDNLTDVEVSENEEAKYLAKKERKTNGTKTNGTKTNGTKANAVAKGRGRKPGPKSSKKGKVGPASKTGRASRSKSEPSNDEKAETDKEENGDENDSRSKVSSARGSARKRAGPKSRTTPAAKKGRGRTARTPSPAPDSDAAGGGATDKEDNATEVNGNSDKETDAGSAKASGSKKRTGPKSRTRR